MPIRHAISWIESSIPIHDHGAILRPPSTATVYRRASRRQTTERRSSAAEQRADSVCAGCGAHKMTTRHRRDGVDGPGSFKRDQRGLEYSELTCMIRIWGIGP